MRQIVNIWVVTLFLLALTMFSNPADAQFSGGGGSPASPPAKTLSAADLQTACDGGNAIACSDLGVFYTTGNGVTKDAKTATTLFQRGCDGGDGAGCFDLAENYRIGYGVAKDIKTAAAFYLRACDGKVSRGCTELAILHGSGEGVTQDLAKAALYADRGCKGGAALGCAILGAVYAEGTTGYPKDIAKAEKLLFDACFDKADFKVTPDAASQVACPALANLQNKPACLTSTNIGDGATETVCYNTADRTWKAAVVPASAPPPDPAVISNAAVDAGNAAYARKDFATAAAQYATACDAGNASACGALGGLYLKGEGVSASGARAAAPLAKACDGGITAYCGSLGVLYDSGNGVSVNKVRAFTLFNGACSRSDMASCYNLGRLYESGQGTTGNVAQAASLYQNACTAGIADACSSIGTMYVNGVHFARSDSQAMSFFNLACSKGRQNSCEQAARIKSAFARDSELREAKLAINRPARAANSPNCTKAIPLADTNVSDAERYARLGISLNDPTCIFILGIVNDKRGDYEMAFAYYSNAANKSDGYAILNIGTFYHNGNYVDRNYQTSILWSKRALAIAQNQGDTRLVKLAKSAIAGSEEALRPRPVLIQDRPDPRNWQACMQANRSRAVELPC